MKKILAIAVLSILLPLAASAQERLEFLGTPIEGNVKSMTNSLKKNGFTPDRYRSGLMYGKYHKQKAQLLLGVDAEGSDKVQLLAITYDAQKSWKSTVSLYESTKMALTAEYGQPSMTREEYDYPYTAEDGFRALDEGKCRYITTYSIYEGGTTDNGAPVGSAAALRKDGGKPFLGEITLIISPEDRKVRVYFRVVD